MTSPSLKPPQGRQRALSSATTATSKSQTKFRRLIRKCRSSETPWTDNMPAPVPQSPSSGVDNPTTDVRKALVDPTASVGPEATIAAFSPNQQTTHSKSRNANSILIHHKTPLLVATPPQVTRALAYSHPFILPLNHVAGLLTWSTGDPWESFLLLAAFVFAVLYGDHVVRAVGPLVLVITVIAAMYTRKYSPLSTSIWKPEKKSKKQANADSRKSLDEILDTLQTFTKRCDLLLEPLLRLTDFLSTQTSATQSTTRPALTTLFLRLLALTPIWYGLTLPPLLLITTQRVVLIIGIVGLTWHSRPARVTRTILWRSRPIRLITATITGLQFRGLPNAAPALPARRRLETKGLSGEGTVRFTFTLYENQRRWLGIGWTSGMLLHERQAWTDEHNNPSTEPKDFTLPATDANAGTKWVWAPNSEWHIEGVATSDKGKDEADIGWTFYDWQWHDPRKSDTWGRYTRRRKWARDAELVEADAEASGLSADETASPDGPTRRKGWFGKRPGGRSAKSDLNLSSSKDKSDDISVSGTGSTGETARSRDGPEDDVHTPHRYRAADWDRSIGEGLAEGLS